MYYFSLRKHTFRSATYIGSSFHADTLRAMTCAQDQGSLEGEVEFVD